MIELNYIDTGFGSKLIDFTQNPFNNVDNQATIEFGFGNNLFNIDGFSTAFATLNNEEASIVEGQEPSALLGSYTVNFSHTGIQYKSSDSLMNFHSTNSIILNDDNFIRTEGMTNDFEEITVLIEHIILSGVNKLRFNFSTAAEETWSFIISEDSSGSDEFNAGIFINTILSGLGVTEISNNFRMIISSVSGINEDGKMFSITSNYSDNNNVIAEYIDKDGNIQTSDPLSIPTNGIVNLNNFSVGGSSLFEHDPKINIDFDSDGDIGTDTSNITLTVQDVYINSKCTNFGSKKLEGIEPLKKKIVKYEYEDIFERGEISLNKNSTGEIAIKNKLISIPILSCKTFISGLASDVTVNIEKIATRKFSVFNPSNRKIQVKYIASFNNVKKTKIHHNQAEIDYKNKITSKYSINYVITSEPKYATTKVRKVDVMNTSEDTNPEYTENPIPDTRHELVFGRTGTSALFSLPEISKTNMFFSFHMPTLSEAVQGANEYNSTSMPLSTIIDLSTNELVSPIKLVTGALLNNNPIYNVEDIDNEENSTVAADNPTTQYPFGLHVQLDNEYYFWYSPTFVGSENPDDPGAWLYSTIRFPNSITYN